MNELCRSIVTKHHHQETTVLPHLLIHHAGHARWSLLTQRYSGCLVRFFAGSAHRTAVIPRAHQRNEESVRALARRYGINPTTVQRWRRWTSVADRQMGLARWQCRG
ncbi:helix-turn-helix domain-containing protein [Rubellimicrobium rubrum]|uniref:Helix-turn-helix domain-containing protein n=1 Tax=Rubellimicrobium rubrum TaxID=2585369 RepID=A0A5C4MVM6_9RHOB|nr:helix-turn-helix domain-containing protein [Rubellimicrobium rubrum]